jgi:hypothetical protein
MMELVLCIENPACCPNENPSGYRCCARILEQVIFPLKAIGGKRKIVRQASPEQAVAGGNESVYWGPKAGVRTLTFDSDVLIRQVSLKHRVWQRRLVVPVGS